MLETCRANPAQTALSAVHCVRLLPSEHGELSSGLSRRISRRPHSPIAEERPRAESSLSRRCDLAQDIVQHLAPNAGRVLGGFILVLSKGKKARPVRPQISPLRLNTKGFHDIACLQRRGDVARQGASRPDFKRGLGQARDSLKYS